MKIYAHRGSSLIWPENTMFAFEQADAVGAEGFETDLRLSRDNEIVLSHDDNLRRVGRPDLTISALNAKEVCRIEIRSPDARHTGRLLTLRMLLERFPEKSYIFDCKITSEPMIQKLKSLLEELKFHNRIWFLTWSRRADELLDHYFPGYDYFPRESLSRRWAMLNIIGLGGVAAPPRRILSLPAHYHGLPVFNRSQIQRLQAGGREFVGYIVNTEKDFRRCVDCGVETVLTDRPDLISELAV